MSIALHLPSIDFSHFKKEQSAVSSQLQCQQDDPSLSEWLVGFTPY